MVSSSFLMTHCSGRVGQEGGAIDVAGCTRGYVNGSSLKLQGKNPVTSKNANLPEETTSNPNHHTLPQFQQAVGVIQMGKPHFAVSWH
jgi:hypothetical protein